MIKKTIFLLVVLFVISCNNKKKYCFNFESEIYLLKLEFKGVYIKQFNDYRNHGLTTVVINLDSGNLYLKQNLFQDDEFYKNLNSGDSIFKDKVSLDIEVKHLDTTVIYRNYCNDFRFKLVDDSLIRIN